MAKYYLTISLVLLLIFCCTINSPSREFPSWKVPGQVITGCNIRKALKDSSQHHQTNTLVLLTILLSNDVQSNPGPTVRNMYPCGLCAKHVKISGVACDGCDVWYHRSCMSICPADFKILEQVQWFCHNCDSLTFRSYSIDNSSNFYSPSLDLDASIGSFHAGQSFSPHHISSPKDRNIRSPTPAHTSPNTGASVPPRKNNTKPFWRYVKARRQDNIGVVPLKEGATLVSDSVSKTKILLKQFCSVFTKDDGSTLPQMESPESPTIDDLIIREEGVAKLLRNLNASKACGPRCYTQQNPHDLHRHPGIAPHLHFQPLPCKWQSYHQTG